MEDLFVLKRRLLSSSEAYRYIGIGRDTLKEEGDRGNIKFVQVGSHRKYTKSACDAWLEKKEQTYGRSL